MSEGVTRRFLDELNQLISDADRVQGLLDAMPARLQLVRLALAMQQADVRVALATGAGAAAGPDSALESGDVPAWLANWWPELVRRVNEAAREAAGGGRSDEAATAERLAQFRRNSLAPLKELIEQIDPRCRALATTELRNVADQYAHITVRLAELEQRASGAGAATPDAPDWSGKVEFSSRDLGDVIYVADANGARVPQIRLAALADLVDHINRDLQATFSVQQSGRENPARPTDSVAAAEADLKELLVALLDMKHQMAEAREENRAPAAVFSDMTFAENRINQTLRTLDLEEIRLRPGDQVSLDCVILGSEAPRSPSYSSGSVNRVVIPGYKYHSKPERPPTVWTVQ